MPAAREAPERVLFAERLRVPVGWWVLAVLFAASLLLAFLFYLGWAWAALVFSTSLLLATAVFSSAALRVEVTPSTLRVGRAMIEMDHVGGCEALDAARTRRRAGRDADVRAYLVLRPYIPTAVEVIVDDESDPTPYWLVSTRRPAELAAAVATARGARRPDAGH